MSEFKSYSPDVEVVGDVIEAFIAGFPSEMTNMGLDVLQKHGIAQPRRGDYYPLQSLLNAMKEIEARFSSQMLYRIGEHIAGNAMLPPGIDSLEICLGSIDQAYHMNHRGGEIGRYEYTPLEEKSGLKRGRMVCANPYPCSFDRGVIEGFAQRFKPPEVRDVIVLHDESEECRRQFGESCTYTVTWG